jgi:AcrR family transcriptional regulator
MTAAEGCVEQHGIRKTTMDDIARKAGVSRPSVYRYFSDRDDILMAVTEERSRALAESARRFILRQTSFADALVEGIIYLADHGVRDPFTYHLVSSDDSSFKQRLLARTAGRAELAAGFWAPLFDRAEREGQLRRGLDRESAYHWLTDVGLMVMSHMERDVADTENIRSQLRQFVVPAFLPLATGRSRSSAVS